MTAEQETLLTIGELAERTRVSTSTLRAWERRLGFPVPARTAGGQRRYRDGDVALVRRVQGDRERGLSLEAAVAGAVRAGRQGDDSLYAGLRRDFPDVDPITVSARTLLALTWSVEDECLVQASHPTVLGCFQNRGSYVTAGRRWRELARCAESAVVFSDFEETRPDERPARVALPAGSPMLNEWSLVCLDAQVAVALVGWERPGAGTGGSRRFEVVLSMEPRVVQSAVERLLDVAAAAGVTWPAAPAVVPGAGGAVDARAVAWLRRFADYADARMR